MSRKNDVYKLKDGYFPSVEESHGNLVYVIPVDSGHVSIICEFVISESDLLALKSSKLRFMAFHYVLYREIQATFGIGHPSPRAYTKEEFEACKAKVLYCPDDELDSYIRLFSNERNLSESYFANFCSYYDD